MNSEQKQLQQLSAAVENYSATKAPPVFELFAALVAMSISILLFILVDVFKQDGTFYELMRAIMPQVGWAIAYFSAGMMGAIGMLINSNLLRIVALALSAAIFGITAAFYIAIFPNVAGILMFWITIFTVVSIPMVKFTGLRK